MGPDDDDVTPRGEPDVDAALAALLDAERHADAVRERAGARWQAQVAEEAGGLAGTLLDLAERGTVVALRTTSGRVHQGAVTALGADFAALRTTAGATVWVRMDAIAVVRPEPGFRHPAADGERPAPDDLLLAEALALRLDDRPRVVAFVAGSGEPVAGELRAVGDGVLTLRLDGTPPTPCYVRLSSVSELSLLDGSG